MQIMDSLSEFRLTDNHSSWDVSADALSIEWDKFSIDLCSQFIPYNI